MNACTAIGEAPPRRQNPWSDPAGRSRRHYPSTYDLHRIAWEVEHGGRCSGGPGAAEDRCAEHPPHHPMAELGDLVEAVDLWLYAVPDGTVGRVVWSGEIDGCREVVIAWTTGRSTTHPAPLRLPRAAAPTGWALDAVGDPRWTLSPARRPKLERAP